MAVGIGIPAIVWLLFETRVVEIHQWVTIGKTKGADRYVAFDPSKTSARDGYVLMDVVFSFTTPQLNAADHNKPYRSIKELRAFDCNKRAVGVIERSIYPDESARGEMIVTLQKRKSPAEVEIKPSSPNSVGEQILDGACGHISRPGIWWSAFKVTAFGAEPNSLDDLTH